MDNGDLQTGLQDGLLPGDAGNSGRQNNRLPSHRSRHGVFTQVTGLFTRTSPVETEV